MVLRAGPTDVVRGSTIAGQVPPSVTLEASYQLLFALLGIHFLLADE